MSAPSKMQVINNEMAEPPYPANTRAKGWRFELDYERIEQSDTWALAPAEMRPWLLMLWMTAWRQSPCGSLPNSDSLIAVRIGMPERQFSGHRDILMRGWVLHSDGRLYHRVITEQVLGFIDHCRRESKRKAEWRAKKNQALSDDVPRDRHVSHAGATTPEPEPEPEPIEEAPRVVPVADAPARRAAKKAPRDFVVTPELREWASAKAPLVDIERQTESFMDCTFGTARSDWAGTWRNWMRKEQQHAERRPGSRSGLTQSGPSQYVLDQRKKIQEWSGGLINFPTQEDPNVIDITGHQGP